MSTVCGPGRFRVVLAVIPPRIGRSAARSSGSDHPRAEPRALDGDAHESAVTPGLFADTAFVAVQ
ncbi:hypothetical protein [Microbacterium barkeri]|uniref:hypothetical protein n=1 Tax=Microbacterium barkeri TaxID=33917 RepID=UPI0022F24E42|nr:hypothetical protein [Microbacterium barkeri]